MKFIRIWILAFIFFPICTFTAAAQAVALSLDEAVKRALDQSINLRRGAIDLAQAEYSANRLWSEIFPGFNLSAGMDFLPRTPLFTDPGFSYETDRLSYSFNFGLRLSLNPSLRASMNRITLAYRTQLLAYEDAARQLELRVTKSFLQLGMMKETTDHMEQSLQSAVRTMENNRAAWQNGQLSELTWLNSRLSVETARYDLSTVRVAYENALGEFLALLGMDAGTDIVFSGSIDIVPALYDSEQLILEHLPKRPDIISQRQSIERLELGRSITTLSNRSPTLDISTQWAGGTPGGNTQGFGAPFTDSLSGSLSLTIPIDSWIPGTRQNQNIRAAGAEVEKAKLELQNIETQAKTQIRSLVSNLRNTWESIEIARLRLDLARRTADAAEEAFARGTAAFQELEDRRRDMTDARQRLLQIELGYQNLLLDLASALNVEWRTLL